MTNKKFLLVNGRALQGTAQVEEMLEVAVMAAGFGQEVHLAFLDDGVFQLLPGRVTEGVGGGALADALTRLADYDIEHVWVEGPALDRRGLRAEDLAIPVTLVDAAAMSALMADMDVIFSA